jgi:ribosomal protein S25
MEDERFNELLERTKEFIKDKTEITPSMIQRHLRIGLYLANMILVKLEKNRIIELSGRTYKAL